MKIVPMLVLLHVYRVVAVNGNIIIWDKLKNKGYSLAANSYGLCRVLLIVRNLRAFNILGFVLTLIIYFIIKLIKTLLNYYQ